MSALVIFGLVALVVVIGWYTAREPTKELIRFILRARQHWKAADRGEAPARASGGYTISEPIKPPVGMPRTPSERAKAQAIKEANRSRGRK